MQIEGKRQLFCSPNLGIISHFGNSLKTNTLTRRNLSLVPIWESSEFSIPSSLVPDSLEVFELQSFAISNRFGTRLALEDGMSSEMNSGVAAKNPELANPGAVLLDGAEVSAMRKRLHDLANVFTGIMIAGGLMAQYLEDSSLRSYADDICEGSERGCILVREIRSQLLAACGELEAAPTGQSNEPDMPE